MLSAKSNKQIYFAGNIQDPKSREYECVQCDEKVSHVSKHLRAGRERVTEHFRHGKNATHPLRGRSSMQVDALDFILDKLQQEYEVELFTDKSYPTSRGDLPTDILAREHNADGSYIDTIINVEANPFNYNDYLAVHRALSQREVYMMNVLCAKGDSNPRGKFLQKEYRRASGETVIKLGKNEKQLYHDAGLGIYFDHDVAALKLLYFTDYEEYCQSDVYSGDRLIREEGELITFETKKQVDVRRTLTDRFKFHRYERNGRLWTLPRELSVSDFIAKERLAEHRDNEEKHYEFSERVGIMLENCSEEQLAELTEKHGAEVMGMFAAD